MRRALLLSLALLLPACGGGGDEKAAFVEDAKTICDKAAAETDALTFPKAPVEFAPYADRLVEIAKQAQSELTALEIPDADEKDLQRKVFDPFADVIDEGRRFAAQVRAAGEDQAKLLPLLSQLPDAGDVDLDYLRSYGLGTCADVIERK